MTVNDNHEENYPANRVEDLLAKASAEQLKEWIAGGAASLPEQMSPTWHGRALRLLSVLLPALTYLRDHGDLVLDRTSMVQSFSLESMAKLAFFANLPNEISEKILRYLEDLPGYNRQYALIGQFDNGARKLQDYLLCELGIEKKLA
ncbi:hypothetical protein D3C87_347750 [compost metagenome]